jgi:peptidoglycan/LPS O-acetylase OafA/YrhL
MEPTTLDPPVVRQTRHVAGLDAIRLVCALWVLFGHVGFLPLVAGIDRTSRLGYLIAGAFTNAVSGPAAVVVFFVISGFCIHYPFRDGAPVPLTAFYSRRYARVLIPMAAAILLGRPLGIKLGVLSDSILWSLVAEEIYYFLYPGLHALRHLVSFRPLIVLAYLLAILVVLRDPWAGDYPSYGPSLNWVLGLPCWLLGCELAERPLPRGPTVREIWLWRLGVWFVSSVTSVLRFHSPLKYPWTLNVFALLVFFWLAREIAYARVSRPSSFLERGGKWSYSIYLCHLHGAALYESLGLPFLGYLLGWIVKTSFVLLVCYVFYRVVEKPSHTLARRIGQRLLLSAG